MPSFPSHLVLISCVLLLLLSFDQFLKRRSSSPPPPPSPSPRRPPPTPPPPTSPRPKSSKSRTPPPSPPQPPPPPPLPPPIVVEFYLPPMATTPPPTCTAAPNAHPAADGNWNETALLVIDMQKDFVAPEMGSKMLVDGGEAIVPAVAEAVDVARRRGIQVVWVVREHDPFGRDVELFRRNFYAGGNGPVTKGSKGAELADGLTIRDGDYKLVKTRFSAFFATNLDSFLKSSGIKNVVIVGLQTPNCIRQTVFDAVSLDYHQVTVIIDATAADQPEIHLSNIRDMKNIGVSTPKLDEWCAN